MYYDELICSPTEEYLGCVQIFSIINKVSINTHVQIFVWTKLKFSS